MARWLTAGLLPIVTAAACLGDTVIANWDLGEKRHGPLDSPRDCGSWHFCVAVPTGVELDRVALGASRSLRLGDGAALVDCAASREPATVAALAELTIGRGARVGSVYGSAAAPLSIGAGTAVRGFVKASSTLRLDPGAVVTFGTLEGVADPGEFYDWRAEPPTRLEDARGAIEPESRTLAPGAYDELSVGPGMEVTLRTGQHYFRSLTVAEHGQLTIDDSKGPVYVWVRDQLTLADALRCSSCPSLVLGYGGTAAVEVASGFCGILVAPRASLTLLDSTRPYRGAFFASTLDVGADVVVQHDPFCSPGERQYGRQCHESGR
jgi:hypothetical protein